MNQTENLSSFILKSKNSATFFAVFCFSERKIVIFSLQDTLRFGDQVSQSVKKWTACSVFFFNFYNMIFYGSHLYVDVPERESPEYYIKICFRDLQAVLYNIDFR